MYLHYLPGPAIVNAFSVHRSKSFYQLRSYNINRTKLRRSEIITELSDHVRLVLGYSLSVRVHKLPIIHIQH